MVKVTEPMTMITDYLVTIVTTILALLLLLQKDGVHSGTVWLASSLIITGIGAVLGGTSHGFKDNFSEDLNERLWSWTTYTIGIAAFCMVISMILTSVHSHTIQYLLYLVSIVQVLVYLWWMTSHSEFLYVSINYLISMVLVIVLKILSYTSDNDPSSIWIISSVLVSFFAAGIQASGLTIHPKYFNHNDLFHVIQLAGFYLMYQAGIRLILF